MSSFATQVTVAVENHLVSLPGLNEPSASALLSFSADECAFRSVFEGSDRAGLEICFPRARKACTAAADRAYPAHSNLKLILRLAASTAAMDYLRT